MSSVATLPPNDYSSTPCKFFKVGHCKYGTSCQFLHPPTCTIPQCPKTYCPNRHPQQCKHYLKFGYCKFADTCSYTHSVASPPISCPTNSTCDNILIELQTLKSLISSLSTQLNGYGPILSSLQQLSNNHPQQSPSLNSPSHALYPPSIDQKHSPLLTIQNKSPSTHNSPSPSTAPNTYSCQTISSKSPPSVPNPPPITTTPNNYPCQTDSPKSPSPASNQPSPDRSSETLMFSCDYCDYKSRLKRFLNRHITLKHKKNVQTMSIP